MTSYTPNLIPVQAVKALPEAQRPSYSAAEEGGRSEHYIRERREASRHGLFGAGFRVRRIRRAVTVTFGSVFLEH